MAIRIGCGSWADEDYVGLLYPKELPAKERLRAYATWFERVEVNASAYRTPLRSTVADWARQTPPNFIFDIKLHRVFSADPHTSGQTDFVGKFVSAFEPLIAANKLGAFLLTLAPSFTPKAHRLEEIDVLAEKLQPHTLAVELRNRAWVEAGQLESTLDHFRSRKLVWVALDFPHLPSAKLIPPIDEVTNPNLAYLRLHGRNPNYLKAKSAAERHEHDYTATELEEIAARIRSLAGRAENVHVSANNHASTYAPKAALALRQLLDQPVAAMPVPGGIT
ncbi:MAG TPA: DUF72 domain-containing protein [Opitutus sp.]|nr:DUF72 domain-containing protein [Opitutus sp.]